MSKKTFFILGGAFLVGLLFFIGMLLISSDSETVKVDELIPKATNSEVFIPITGEVEPELESQIDEEEVSELEPVATPTPTPEPRIIEYVVDGVFDFKSGKSTSMSVFLADGRVIESTWANAIGFDSTLDESVEFDPYKGTVFSYLSETLTVKAHSGYVSLGDLFANQLELYVRTDLNDTTLSIESGREQVEALKGAKVLWCQSADEQPTFSKIDSNNCSGKEVWFEIVGAVLAEGDMAVGADKATQTWVMDNYLNSGFESISADDGLILITCIGQMYNQDKDIKIPAYLVNRLILGMKLVEVEGQ